MRKGVVACLSLFATAISPVTALATAPDTEATASPTDQSAGKNVDAAMPVQATAESVEKQNSVPSTSASETKQADTPAALELHLVCRGTGDREVQSVGTAVAFAGGHTAFALGTQTGRQMFDEQMDIDITGETAQVRVPRRFLPPIHGGSDGWFQVKQLRVGPDEITGKVAVNFANHPKLRIDRRTGSVAMDGNVGSFAGQCEKVDPHLHAF